MSNIREWISLVEVMDASQSEILSETWKTPPLLFHCTLAENVPSIMAQGLNPARSKGYHGVFLAVDQYQASNYANSYHSGEDDGQYVLLAIKLAALDKKLLEPDGDDLPEMLWNNGIHNKTWQDCTWRQSLRIVGQCSYAGVIPPAAITVVGKV